MAPEKDYGPTWYDCADFMGSLLRNWRVQCIISITPPPRFMDGAPDGSWGVGVRAVDCAEGKELRGSASERWGKGGAHKTAPGALHAALRRIEEQLEEKARRRVAQTRF